VFEANVTTDLINLITASDKNHYTLKQLGNVTVLFARQVCFTSQMIVCLSSQPLSEYVTPVTFSRSFNKTALEDTDSQPMVLAGLTASGFYATDHWPPPC